MIDYKDPNYKPWTDVDEYREAAITFLKNGYYCPFPEGTISYNNYWDNQEHYIRKGFVHPKTKRRISGLYYLYLNFCPIYNKKEKKYVFPDFWDLDAAYFEELEANMGLGPQGDITRTLGTVIAKARQKGASLKGCVPALFMFNFMPGSKTYIGAHLEEYAKKTWSMFMTYYNHLLQYTDLGKNYLVLRANSYLKSGYIEYVNGRPTESGFQSEISVVTFKQSAESGVGGAVDLMILEEAGIFLNLAEVIGYVTPACKDGDIITGHILAYGAAGSLEKAEPLRVLFYNPDKMGFKEYDNIWDDNKYGTKCGMFIPDYMCRKPHIDINGNSLIEPAIAARDKELEKLRKDDFEKYMLKLSQHPNKPSEMFEMRSKARFNTKILDQQIAFLETREGLGTAIELYRDIETNKVKYKYSEKQPIREYPFPKGADKEGCVEVWEFPPEFPTKGLYISSIDSYNQDDSSTTSLGSIFIYKKISDLSGENTSRIIVAEYTGRPSNKQDFYKICRMLLELYSATCLVENEDHELTPWFITNECDYLLADQPDIIRMILPNSTVKRTKGIHAATGLILAGDQKIQRYLEEVIGKEYNEEGVLIKEKLGVTRIPSLGLLKELRAYVLDNNKNFDRVRTFEWLLLYEEETHFEEAKSFDDRELNFFGNTKRFGRSSSHIPVNNPRNLVGNSSW